METWDLWDPAHCKHCETWEVWGELQQKRCNTYPWHLENKCTKNSAKLVGVLSSPPLYFLTFFLCCLLLLLLLLLPSAVSIRVCVCWGSWCLAPLFLCLFCPSSASFSTSTFYFSFLPCLPFSRASFCSGCQAPTSPDPAFFSCLLLFLFLFCYWVLLAFWFIFLFSVLVLFMEGFRCGGGRKAPPDLTPSPFGFHFVLSCFL